MKLRLYVVLMALLALSTIAGIPLLRPPSSHASVPHQVKESARAWARENYRRALDLVFQDRCTSSNDARWLSCVRILPGFSEDEIEYSLSVEKRYSGTVVAHITRPKLQSVYTQLRRRKQEYPRASVSNIAKLIQVESWEGDVRRFPELMRLADELENIRLSPVFPDELMMDPTEYFFRVRSPYGNLMEVTLYGPGSAASYQSEPLIQWAESTRRMLERSFNK